jgi:hypothetical protein
MAIMAPKALKTIRSHAGYSRFLATLDLDSEGLPVVVREIPRPSNIPSPYSYSPEWEVYRLNGREVIVRETAQRCYNVFAVESAEYN